MIVSDSLNLQNATFFYGNCLLKRYIQYILHIIHTACPRNSDQFYIVTYYIKWVTTSWTDSTRLARSYGLTEGQIAV